MNEESYESITKQDIEDFKSETSHLVDISKDFVDLSEKYLNFRLQLIAIAGATFSIYVALHSHTTVSGGFTTYGFVSLAVSLLFGFLSVVFSLVNKGSEIWYRFFDFDKAIELKSEGFKKLLKLAGHPAQPQLYDSSYKKLEARNEGRIALRLIRDFSTSITQHISLYLGVGQILAFLIATIFLVAGLLFV
jgi:hypothetical protein